MPDPNDTNARVGNPYDGALSTELRAEYEEKKAQYKNEVVEIKEATPIIIHGKIKKKKDTGPKPSDQMLPKDKASRLEGFSDRVYRKEYQSAARMYQTLLKRGDKPAIALGRAAGTHRHVTHRALQKFISQTK